jgi:hypothetical protein
VLVLLGPVLGLVAILRHQTLSELAQAAGTAIWQSLSLTVVATLHLISMVYVASLPLPGMGALLLMFALTVVLWWAVGPWQRLRAMVSAGAAVAGAEVSAGKPRARLEDRVRSAVSGAQERARTPLPDEDEQWRPMRPEAASYEPYRADQGSPPSAGPRAEGSDTIRREPAPTPGADRVGRHRDDDPVVVVDMPRRRRPPPDDGVPANDPPARPVPVREERDA